MPTARDYRSFAFQTLMALGAFACILAFITEFFGIKSKDIHMHIGWPVWMWFVCGLVLFAISITSSVRSLRASLAGTPKAEPPSDELEEVAAHNKLLMELSYKNQQLNSKDQQINELKLMKLNGVPLFNYEAIQYQRVKTRQAYRVDLLGEILELLYNTEHKLFMIAGHQIVANVRVTNRGDDAVAITGWKLRIDIGKDSWTADRDKLPASLTIERFPNQDIFATASPSTQENLSEFPRQALTKGVPQEGWLFFKVINWSVHADFPKCAQITFFAMDSYGNEHLIMQPCGRYVERGKIAYKKG